MSTTETPPPADTPVAGPPERRCPRCGSALSADQEWCLNCGAAAGTEVVEARGWRVPLYLGGGLAALAVIGVILAIVALTNRNDVVAGNPTPTPTPSSAAPPGASASPSPLPTLDPLPSATASPTDPNATPTASPDPNAPPVTPTPDASETTTPEPTPTEDAGTTDSGSGSTIPEWSGQDGNYTIIIASNPSREGAEKIAQKAIDNTENDIGMLESSDYSSLRSGYWVVYSGTYSTKSDAEDALSTVRADHKDAYVSQIKGKTGT